VFAVPPFRGGSEDRLRSYWIGRGLVVIEAWRSSPKVIELLRRVQDTQVFLRMAAVELRRIAEQTPDIAVEARLIAQKLEAEAEALARRDAE
jgi:hypothetical protein